MAVKDKHVIVRAASAGVFAGTLVALKSGVATLKDVRRLWFWKGAASLSQLAQEGVKNPDECKFSMAVKDQKVLGVIEILYTTPEAKKNILAVPVWRM